MIERDEVAIREKMGCIWVVLPDAITIDTHASIEAEIDKTISAQNPKVVLDMSETNNLFSSGLGLLIHVSKRANGLNGSVCLVNVSEKIRNMLATVHLDAMFPLYATDVEFEITQEHFEGRLMGKKFGFVFISRIEDGVCRINCSGHMTAEQDLSEASRFIADKAVGRYLFDLTGLDMIDSSGAAILIKIARDIRERGAKCVAYGAGQGVVELMTLLGMDEYIAFTADERGALGYRGQ